MGKLTNIRNYNPECDPDYERDPENPNDPAISSTAVPSDELLDRTRECLRKAGLSEYTVLVWTPDVAEFVQQELDRQASDAVEKEREKIADDLERYAEKCDTDHQFVMYALKYLQKLRGQSK